MRRNIMLPEEEENTPSSLTVPSKGNEKRSSNCSNMSEQDIPFVSKWKTNLLISEDAERVQKRDHGYRKNTSFENKIINDHIKVMVRCVCHQEGLDMWKCQGGFNTISQQQSMIKEGIVKEKVQQQIESNTYLTEEEKSDFLPMFCENYDNYQILTKTMSRLQARSVWREELAFILFKIVEFITNNYEVKLRKYDEEFMEAQVPKRLAEVSSLITTHQNVKLINPEYFYNTNEAKYMYIIERWFYCIFAIKLGIYANKYMGKTELNMEMKQQ